MMRLLPLVLFALLGFAGTSAVIGSADDPPVTSTVTVTVEATYQGKDIRWWAAHAVRNRRELNHLYRVNRVLRSALRGSVPLGRRTLQAHVAPSANWLERAFLCIHGFEGSWTDSGAPFWGGVQMDGSFMSSYGGPFLRAFGTADHWTPAMQITVAEIAYLSGRGFYPWPNTARMCGLL